MAHDREALRGQLTAITEAFSTCSMRLRLPLIVASNLTLQQLKVMSLLLGNQPRAHDLSVALGITPATVSGLVARLVEHGLVAQLPDPADKRSRRLQLTPEGITALDELNSLQQQHRLAAEDQMTDEELHALLIGLRGFVRGLHAQEQAELDVAAPAGPDDQPE